jgi:hypothetical protein
MRYIVKRTKLKVGAYKTEWGFRGDEYHLVRHSMTNLVVVTWLFYNINQIVNNQ